MDEDDSIICEICQGTGEVCGDAGPEECPECLGLGEKPYRDYSSGNTEGE